MTTIPSSQVTGGHPAPWIDNHTISADAITTASSNSEFSDCENGSLVIDITPMVESDVEATNNNLHFQTSTASDAVVNEDNHIGRGPKSRCADETDDVELDADDCILLDHDEQLIVEKPMGEKVINEKAMGEKAKGEKAMGEKVVGEKAIGEIVLSEKAIGEEATNDVIEIDLIAEEEEETSPKIFPIAAMEPTVVHSPQRQLSDKDVYVLSISDSCEVTVICPDSADESDVDDDQNKTHDDSVNNTRSSSSHSTHDDLEPSSEKVTDKTANVISLGPQQEKANQFDPIVITDSSLGSEVSPLTRCSAAQLDSRSEQTLESHGQSDATQGSSSTRVTGGHVVVAPEKMSNSALQVVENREVQRTERSLAENMDRTLISYLTDFPSKMYALSAADPTLQTNCVTSSSVVVSGTSFDDSARLNSTTAASSSVTHKLTDASLGTSQPSLSSASLGTSQPSLSQPSLRTSQPSLSSMIAPCWTTPSASSNDIQMVGQTTKKQKRRRSPSSSSVIPVHVKEEKVDDSYETSPQPPATKVQVVVDASWGQRLVASRQPPIASPCFVARMPAGSQRSGSNPPHSVISIPSAAGGTLPSARSRTMPAYRFCHFRSTPMTTKNVPTATLRSGSYPLTRFVSVFPQATPPLPPPRPQSHRHPIKSVVPRYLLDNSVRAKPIQPKAIPSSSSSAPCFILVNRQNPGSPQITTTYAIPSSVPTPSLRAKLDAPPPLSNEKNARPLKVRPSNTNAALLTRKFEKLYKKSILPKFVSPKLMPGALHVSGPVRTLACEGCGDEFVTERGLSDHYERKSVVISFTCRCDKRVMLFYNMCSFARYYERHTSGESSLNVLRNHSSYQSCVMAMLPTYLMPPEYRQMATSDESRKNPATSDGSRKRPATSDASRKNPIATPPTIAHACAGGFFTDDAAHSSTKMPESDVTCEQPSPPLLSLKDFFVRLDSRDVRCSECSVLYKRRKGLAAHMSARRSTPKFAEQYRCDKCCMVLPNHCSFRAHTRIHDKVEPYVCPECGQTFRTSRDIFMTHVKRVCLHFSRFEGRQCPICSTALTQSAEAMVAHLEHAHAASYHKCDRCSLVFPTEKSFHAHNLAQHDDSSTYTRLRKCPVCNAAKKESESLSEHLSEHVSQVGLALRCFFRCLVCRKCFSARTDLVDHMHSEHPKEAISGRMCCVCGTVCENGAELYGHTNVLHPEFMERLQSGETAEDDKTPGKMAESVAGVKPEMGSGKSLECERCQMVLSDEEQFKRHVAKHRFLEGKRAGGKLKEGKGKKKQRREGGKDVVVGAAAVVVVDNDVKIKSEKVEDEVPATPDSIQSTPIRSSCSTSTATSPRSENPRSGDSSDKDLKLWFSCHLCVKTFKNTNDLNQHLKDTHAGKSRLHAYLCWICREQSELKSYPKAGMLIKHLKNYHKIARKNIDYARIASFDNKDEGSATEEDDKPTVCDAPTQVRNLRVEGDAAYNCAKCEYSSTERGEFREHVARHRLNESHQCLECGVCFVALPSLKRHLFVVHRVRDFAKYQNETGISLDLPAEPDSEPESFSSPNADAESSFLSESPSTTLPDKESESALECTVCYRSFADEWTLRQHMRVHGMAFIQGTRRNNMSRKTALTDS